MLCARVQGLIVKVKQKRLTVNTSPPSVSVSLCSAILSGTCFNWVARISRANVLHTCCRQADISRKFALARSLSHVARLLVANFINAESTSIFLPLFLSIFFSFFIASFTPFVGRTNYKWAEILPRDLRERGRFVGL